MTQRDMAPEAAGMGYSRGSLEGLRAWRSRLCVALVGLIALVIYGVTCARKVTGEDSGELLAAAMTLGVAHPPGYPLWCLLAHGFSKLPGLEPAFSIALMSAVFGALTAAALAAIVIVVSGSRIAAVSAALAFAFLRDQWSQSVVAEVYTLNSFLLASAILAALAWDARKSPRRLAFVFVMLGLALTNHHTALGLLPGIGLFLIHRLGWRAFAWRTIWPAALGLVIGLIPYAYLPLAASRAPAINWGNPSGLEAFMAHVTRQQYVDAETLPPRTMGRFADQLGVLFEHATAQGDWWLLGLGVVGFGLLARRRFDVFLLLAPMVALSTLGILWFTNVKLEFESTYATRLFFVPAYMVLAVGFACGFSMVRAAVKPVLARGAIVALMVVTPLGPVVRNWEQSDFSRYTIADTFSRSLLESVEHGAVLFPSSDHTTFPLLYLRYGLGVRPDVTIADKYGYVDPAFLAGTRFEKATLENIRTSWFRRELITWLAAEGRRPLYFTRRDAATAIPGHRMVTAGLWYRLRRSATHPDEVLLEDDMAWRRMRRSGIRDGATPKDYSAKMFLSDVDFSEARHLILNGDAVRAEEVGVRATEHAPESKEIHNNIAALLAENGRAAAAEQLWRSALEIDPGYTMARRNLGILMAASERPEARSILESLLEIDARDVTALRSLAELSRKEEAWVDAAHFLERFADVTNDALAYRDAGLISLMELKDLTRAKRLLQLSLALKPEQPDIREVENRIRPKASKDAQRAGADRASTEGPKAPSIGGEAVGNGPGGGMRLPDPTAGLAPQVGAPAGIPVPKPGTPRRSSPLEGGAR